MSATALAVGPAARRYARAFFEVGQEQGVLPQLSEDMQLLLEITSHPEVSGWLADPRVDDGPKQELLEKELGSRCQAQTLNFLRLIARRRRHGILPQIPHAFRDLADAHEGRLRGTVESATPLDEAATQSLEKALTSRTGKQVVLETQVDPTLLGGIRVTIGGVRYDGSARGRLDAMRRRLADADLGSSSSSDS